MGTHCQKKKGKRETKIGLLHPITANFPFEIIALDIVGPLNTTKQGNNYILGDRGRNFQSHLIEEILLLLGIKQRPTTAYHPQCDGLVETFNRTLLERLAYVNNTNDNWDDHIPYALFAYCTARPEATQFSPYFLLFHREAHLPPDIALRPSNKQIFSDEIFESIDKTFRQVQHTSNRFNQDKSAATIKRENHTATHQVTSYGFSTLSQKKAYARSSSSDGLVHTRSSASMATTQ